MQISEEQNDGWYNFSTFESFTESVWQWENGKYTLKERIENKKRLLIEWEAARLKA